MLRYWTYRPAQQDFINPAGQRLPLVTVCAHHALEPVQGRELTDRQLTDVYQWATARMPRYAGVTHWLLEEEEV